MGNSSGGGGFPPPLPGVRPPEYGGAPHGGEKYPGAAEAGLTLKTGSVDTFILQFQFIGSQVRRAAGSFYERMAQSDGFGHLRIIAEQFQ